VVEVAEEYVEAVNCRHEIVTIAEVVFSELSGLVTQRLKQFGKRWVLLLQPFRRARKANLGKPGADRRLACDEGGSAGGATLLAVPVRKKRTLVGNTVDVGRLIAHHALVVSADVPVADVVAP